MPVTKADDIFVAFITIPSKAAATELARTILDHKLAACVNIVPSIMSLYTWKGKKCEDKEEALMIVKTPGGAFERLCQHVTENHPYEVPEVIAFPLSVGFSAYVKWVREQVPTT